MGLLQTARAAKIGASATHEEKAGASGRVKDPAIVRLYILSTEIFRKVFMLSRACLNGVWLGILDKETLHKIDRHYYNENKKTYCSDKYNRSGLRSWEKDVTDEYFKGCKRLLIVGAGGGRDG